MGTRVRRWEKVGIEIMLDLALNMKLYINLSCCWIPRSYTLSFKDSGLYEMFQEFYLFYQ